MKRFVCGCAIACFLAALPSCIAIGGTNNSPRPTVGQELIDLQTAKEKGAITQAEYDQQKANILSGHRN